MNREHIIPTLDIIVALPEKEAEYEFKDVVEYWIDQLEDYKNIFQLKSASFTRKPRNPKTDKSMVTVRLVGVDDSSIECLYGFTPTFVGETRVETLL